MSSQAFLKTRDVDRPECARSCTAGAPNARSGDVVAPEGSARRALTSITRCVKRHRPVFWDTVYRSRFSDMGKIQIAVDQ